MDRLVTDNPQNNVEVMMNLAFVKDKEVWIRGGDEKGEDCTLIKFAERMCQYSNGCCHYVHGFPTDIVGTDIDAIGDVYMDCSMSGCPIGTAYFIAIQAAELRERLRQYEQTYNQEDGSSKGGETKMSDANIVCPWRVRETKFIEKRIDGDIQETTKREFEECHGYTCPFFKFGNPDAGYPNVCGRPYFGGKEQSE